MTDRPGGRQYPGSTSNDREQSASSCAYEMRDNCVCKQRGVSLAPPVGGSRDCVYRVVAADGAQTEKEVAGHRVRAAEFAVDGATGAPTPDTTLSPVGSVHFQLWTLGCKQL